MLNKSKLLDALRNLPPALNFPDAATNMANVFADYFMDAQAGPTTSQALMWGTLQPIFLASMQSRQFLEVLGTSLQAWISPATWSSTSTVTGITASAAGPVLDAAMKPLIDKALATGQDVLPAIVDAIDRWAKSIQVTTTDSSSGITLVVNIV